MPNNVALATVLKAIKATTLEYKFTVDSLKLYKYDTVKLFVRHHIDSSKQQSRSLNSSSIDGALCRLCSEGKLKEAVGILEQQDIQVDSDTYATLLQFCAKSRALPEGIRIHRQMTRTGFKPSVFAENHLVNMYVKCGRIEDAREVFQEMPVRNVFSWNTMMAGYAKFRRLDFARELFDEMPERDVTSWNTIIAAYEQQGCGEEASRLFWQLICAGVRPNHFTFASVLSASAGLLDVEQGKQLHAYIIRIGFLSNMFVGSALVDTYAKCGSIDDAREVFDQMPVRDVLCWNTMIAGYSQYGNIEIAHLLFEKMPQRNEVSWNTMISGFAQQGQAEEALGLFCQMREAGLKPDQYTLASVLSCWASLAALEHGRQGHGHIIRIGYEIKIPVQNALVAMYAKCGIIRDARRVFNKMPVRDVVSWNAIIAGYAQNCEYEECLKLFWKMQSVGINPNQSSFATILSVFAILACIELGRQVHDHIIKNGFGYDSGVKLANALITMYAGCGSIDDANRVFYKMHKRDVVSWTAMIGGYARHGEGKRALQLFEQMQVAGIKPDHVTLTGVLFACSHSGLVDEGQHVFGSICQDNFIKPRVEHYVCMVDLLGRAGQLKEAEEFINNMPFQPNALVWRTLLGACGMHSNVGLGQRVAEHVFELNPRNAGAYVLLSNIYAAAGRWDDVIKIRMIMKDRGIEKQPGCSWIEVKNKLCGFSVGDR